MKISIEWKIHRMTVKKMYSISSKTVPKLTNDKKSSQLNYKGSETVIKKYAS